MKVGDKVAVLDDGKLCRLSLGVVTKQHNNHHVTVKFKKQSKEYEVKLRKHNSNLKYTGYVTIEVDGVS